MLLRSCVTIERGSRAVPGDNLLVFLAKRRGLVEIVNIHARKYLTKGQIAFTGALLRSQMGGQKVVGRCRRVGSSGGRVLGRVNLLTLH